jgi:putative addiction module component (TIGR02574 family)
MNHQAEFAALFQLPVEERIRLAQDLWESAVEEAPAMSIPAWHLEELAQRAQAFEASPGPLSSWEAVKRRLESSVASVK